MSTTIAIKIGRWFDSVPSRHLDRLAARRMLSHVCGPFSPTPEGHAKTRDQLMIEAWLWRRYGDRAIADTIERGVRTYDKTGVWPWPTEL